MIGFSFIQKWNLFEYYLVVDKSIKLMSQNKMKARLVKKSLVKTSYRFAVIMQRLPEVNHRLRTQTLVKQITMKYV